MTTIRETTLPNRLYQGKVRDTYDLGDGLLLMVATDRISAFDVVLQQASLRRAPFSPRFPSSGST